MRASDIVFYILITYRKIQEGSPLNSAEKNSLEVMKKISKESKYIAYNSLINKDSCSDEIREYAVFIDQ